MRKEELLKETEKLSIELNAYIYIFVLLSNTLINSQRATLFTIIEICKDKININLEVIKLLEVLKLSENEK